MGCDHCYALTLAGRLKAMGQAKYQHDGDPRTSGPGFGVTMHPAELELPKRWRRPRVIFVNSMNDLFHPKVTAQFVAEVFTVMAATPQHTYQVLTKRPKRARQLPRTTAPLPNVWLGVSVESDEQVDRAAVLRDVPASVRFLSCEPLLGPLPSLDLPGIDWVIVGGESGPAPRPIRQDWVTAIRDRCRAAGVPFFKQWGGWTPKAGGRTLDGKTYDEMPEQARIAYPPASVGGSSLARPPVSSCTYVRTASRVTKLTARVTSPIGSARSSLRNWNW
jgi:protein gp37